MKGVGMLVALLLVAGVAALDGTQPPAGPTKPHVVRLDGTQPPASPACPNGGVYPTCKKP